ncbi:MAG: TIGR04282 family arsenosugar biosynthesis glycosyltransferase [Vicingaceae bacterium]
MRSQVQGKVKTRLAQYLGDEEALAVYKWLVKHTMDAIADLPISVHLYFDEPDHRFSMTKGMKVKEQSKGKLDDKLNNALKSCLMDGARKVVIIGSDCPEISGELIMEAFNALDRSDLVVGPAADGGFYLLGQKEQYPSLLKGITWSASTTCRELMTNAVELDLNVHMLQVKRDIDTLTDFRHFEKMYQVYKSNKQSRVL